MMPMLAVTQKFWSGPAHTAVEMRPPGRSTRAISLAASCISGKNMKPNRQLMASKLASGKGNSQTSASWVSEVVDAAPGGIFAGHGQHVFGDVDADDFAAGQHPGDGQAGLAGTGSYVKDHVIGGDVQALDNFHRQWAA